MDLVERDSELQVLHRVLSRLAHGSGSGVAVVGEPGAGKSALVDAACSRQEGLRVLRGRCDPLGTPRPLGPFRDLLQLAPRLTGGSLPEECEEVYDALSSEPTVLVVEDLHWVDAASVEVLRFLLRRVAATPLAVVVTYRADEIGPRHSARPLLGDLATLDVVTTLRLSPLTVQGVTAMLEGTGLDPEQVARVTGGNAFFVAEVAKEPLRPLPDNVRDAVLARTSDIDAHDFEVMQLAAVAPDRLDDRVLPALQVDLPTLRRLHDTGLLLRDCHGLVFRHEIARLAIESTIPAGGLAQLHAVLLQALERIEPRDPVVLTHHAVASADSPRAVRYAREAADEAAAAGAHTEAVAFLHTALNHLDSGRDADRAALLTQLAYEQYMISHLDEAIASVSATFPIWAEVGDSLGLAEAHEFCGIFEYYGARRRQAETHTDRAAELARSPGGPSYASARLTRGYMAVLRNDFGLAQQCCSDADRVAGNHGQDELASRSRFVMAAGDLAIETTGARERLVDVIEEARDRGYDELASTGYSNLCAADVEQRRLRSAERVLEEALAFSSARDIAICNHWQTAVRSRLRLLTGKWDAAQEDALDAAARPGMQLARFWPHVVLGLLQLRRDGSTADHLDLAWQLAESLDEPLRRIPVLTALAERTWLTGQLDDRLLDTPSLELKQAMDSPASAWSAGELAVWMSRIGIDPQVDPERVAEPYRLTLTGRHDEAASWWRQAGAPFDEAMCCADSADVALRTRGIERLDLLGAVTVADRLRLLLRQDGVSAVPQRPQASTRANPAGLTNRQLDVAKLVARGFSNPEIAGRLFISPKTAEVHVSAVLSKLGVANRRAVVVQAAELGLA